MVMKHKVLAEREFRIVPAGELKAKCLQLMEEVNKDRNLTLIITKRGKPVAQMGAPPAGIKILGPVAELLPDGYAGGAAFDGSLSAASEEHRHKKRKGRKRRK
jgi:hypothetical protein